ncbi:MAG: hypothetical protein ACRDY3_08050 [Acidimicrobiales bacterium]
MTEGHHTKGCEAVGGHLAELALGILPGQERSEVLDHVEGCRPCSVALAELSTVVDALAQLAPGAEPPVGFEERVLGACRAPAAPRRAPVRRRVALATAAALVGLGLGLGIGTLVTAPPANGGRAVVPGGLASAPLRSGGADLGRLVVVPGRPSWVLMTLGEGVGHGPLTCQVTLAGGRVETVGRFDPRRGYDTWAAPLDVPAERVRGAALVDAAGHVIASAHLT